MGIVGSIGSQAAHAAWSAVKDTVRGAQAGDVADVAKVVVGAAVLTGTMPASTGIATLAGGVVAGRLLDVFV